MDGVLKTPLQPRKYKFNVASTIDPAPVAGRFVVLLLYPTTYERQNEASVPSVIGN